MPGKLVPSPAPHRGAGLGLGLRHPCMAPTVMSGKRSRAIRLDFAKPWHREEESTAKAPCRPAGWRALPRPIARVLRAGDYAAVSE